MIKKIKKILNNKMSIIILLILFIIGIYVYSRSRSKENFTNKEKMQEYNVIFAGTVKNAESYIENVLIHIDNCGKKFKNYSVIIYENDSEDNTKKILMNNKKENYHYIFENLTEPRRTMRLAHGRNKILEKVKEMNKQNDYTYLIMLDLDDVNSSGKFVKSIESCFDYEYNEWDVLTGNQKTSYYYDIWALRKPGIIDYDCWAEINKPIEERKDENKSVEDIKQIMHNITTKEKGLVEVDSAFGGIAIYKISALKNCKYIGEHYNEYPEHTELCEHVDFHKCIKKNGGKIFINTEFYTD